MTPNGEMYQGLAFQKGSCGVSVIRSGEAMEQGLRDCCRSIRIGKILIQVIQSDNTLNNITFFEHILIILRTRMNWLINR